MMKSFFALVLLVASAQALAYDFFVGEKIVVQELFWRRLPNGDGASCQLQYLGQLTVKEIKAAEIIVQYNSDRTNHPANCSNGVLLSFEPHYLDTHRDLYIDYQAKKSALHKIKSGLSVRSMGNYSVGDKLSFEGWAWAVVEESIEHLREGDLCRLIAPAVVIVEGFYPEKKQTLLSYHGNQQKNLVGANECPENTIFFTKLEN